jgi:DNA-binding protein H-NS
MDGIGRDRTTEFHVLTIDELWALHERITFVLTSRIQSEQQRLDTQLSHLIAVRTTRVSSVHGTRRPYPKVEPKYRSISNPTLTWAGRGKRPRWLIAELNGDKKLDDFRIIGANGPGQTRSGTSRPS